MKKIFFLAALCLSTCVANAQEADRFVGVKSFSYCPY